MTNVPFVTIILVNFNGKHFLEMLIPNLVKQDYPKKKFKIVIFDNNSIDLSESFIKNKYPNITYIAHSTNIGFGAAINRVVEKIDSEYFAILNTDTCVESDWLTQLVARAQSNTMIAAVNSKTYLSTEFSQVSIKIIPSTHSHLANIHDLFFLEEEKNSTNYIFNTNFLLPGIKDMHNFTKLDVLIPISEDSNSNQTFTIHSFQDESEHATIKVTSQNKVLLSQRIQGKEVVQISPKIKNNKIRVIQNAGNTIFKSGFSRDRGAVVKDTTQFYQPDSVFFNTPSLIPAVSGVSCLLKTHAFKEVGMFDENYFMYYEDIDLSIRLRKAGYQLWYEPQSVVHHLHSATSKEWSSFFKAHTEKGRLLLLTKHYPITVFFREYFKYILRTLKTFFQLSLYRYRNNWRQYEILYESFALTIKNILYISNNFVSLRRKYYNSKNGNDIYKTMT